MSVRTYYCTCSTNLLVRLCVFRKVYMYNVLLYININMSCPYPCTGTGTCTQQPSPSQRRTQESAGRCMMECSDAWLRPSYGSGRLPNTIKGLSHSLEHSIVHLPIGYIYRSIDHPRTALLAKIPPQRPRDKTEKNI